MKIKINLLCWLILLAIGCQPEPRPGDVGDIAFDPAQDDPAFELCNERSVKQYYVRGSYDTPAGYRGEKKALVAEFAERYRFPVVEEENGYLTIRFVVNCRGKTGRFRIQEMDFAYQPRSFAPAIRDQLLSIIRELDDWIPVARDEKKYDFYQYLTFRIEKGQLIRIMP